jgi:hypothetical protein
MSWFDTRSIYGYGHISARPVYGYEHRSARPVYGYETMDRLIPLSAFSSPITACTVRPGVQCTFAVMSECDAFTVDPHARQACVAGARDAHLQPTAPRGGYATPRLREAYALGWDSTVVSCPATC